MLMFEVRKLRSTHKSTQSVLAIVLPDDLYELGWSFDECFEAQALMVRGEAEARLAVLWPPSCGNAS